MVDVFVSIKILAYRDLKQEIKRIGWVVSPPSNSHKWRFIRIPYQKWNDPGVDCCWVGVVPKNKSNPNRDRLLITWWLFVTKKTTQLTVQVRLIDWRLSKQKNIWMEAWPPPCPAESLELSLHSLAVDRVPKQIKTSWISGCWMLHNLQENTGLIILDFIHHFLYYKSLQRGYHPNISIYIYIISQYLSRNFHIFRKPKAADSEFWRSWRVSNPLQEFVVKIRPM